MAGRPRHRRHRRHEHSFRTSTPPRSETDSSKVEPGRAGRGGCPLAKAAATGRRSKTTPATLRCNGQSEASRRWPRRLRKAAWQRRSIADATHEIRIKMALFTRRGHRPRLAVTAAAPGYSARGTAACHQGKANEGNKIWKARIEDTVSAWLRALQVECLSHFQGMQQKLNEGISSDEKTSQRPQDSAWKCAP